MNIWLVLALASSLICFKPMPARASDGDNPYDQRIEGVTVTAGDAGRTNAAIHIIDPWPIYARNRHLRFDGPRMSHAIQKYRDGGKAGDAGPAAASPIAPASGESPQATSAAK